MKTTEDLQLDLSWPLLRYEPDDGASVLMCVKTQAMRGSGIFIQKPTAQRRLPRLNGRVRMYHNLTGNGSQILRGTRLWAVTLHTWLKEVNGTVHQRWQLEHIVPNPTDNFKITKEHQRLIINVVHMNFAWCSKFLKTFDNFVWGA